MTSNTARSTSEPHRGHRSDTMRQLSRAYGLSRGIRYVCQSQQAIRGLFGARAVHHLVHRQPTCALIALGNVQVEPRAATKSGWLILTPGRCLREWSEGPVFMLARLGQAMLVCHLSDSVV